MSAETKWTPGPWHVLKARGYAHGPVDKNNAPVVTWTGMARPRQEDGMANAHLIAAAPELYEALEEALETIHALIDEGYMAYIHQRERIEYAMAKARGES